MTTGRINQVTTDSWLRVARPPGGGRVSHRTGTDSLRSERTVPVGLRSATTHGRTPTDQIRLEKCPEADVRGATARDAGPHGVDQERDCRGRNDGRFARHGSLNDSTDLWPGAIDSPAYPHLEESHDPSRPSIGTPQSWIKGTDTHSMNETTRTQDLKSRLHLTGRCLITSAMSVPCQNTGVWPVLRLDVSSI